MVVVQMVRPPIGGRHDKEVIQSDGQNTEKFEPMTLDDSQPYSRLWLAELADPVTYSMNKDFQWLSDGT
jgi:hypothetical protein